MKTSLKLLTIVIPFFITACSKEESFFDHLDLDQDGVVSLKIPDNGEIPEYEEQRLEDELSIKEESLIKQWHGGQTDKVSFIVVDAKNQKIMRSYFGDIPQRLASISKVTTAISALENVKNVEVNKVRNMLKISHNGEASRYVRLAAKAISGLVVTAPSYTAPHSCPGAILNDEPAGEVVLAWIQSILAAVDWTGSDFDDGAGCDYDNFMSPLQTAKIFDYAAKKGAVYGGMEFKKLLSIAGTDGTWEKYNKENKGYIFAKTGTLNPTSNLAGYFLARRGGVFHEYYFAVFINRESGTTSSTNARKLLEAFLRYWVDYYSGYSGEPIKNF